MKSFRKVFIIRKPPFGAVSHLILSVYFFEEIQNGEAISITFIGEWYPQILRNDGIPRIQNEHEGIAYMIFTHIYRQKRLLLKIVL